MISFQFLFSDIFLVRECVFCALDLSSVYITMESPPTSIVVPTNTNFSLIIFNNVEKWYKINTDISCCYTYTEPFQPGRKDWIGIFKVGWKTTREYFTWIFVQSAEESTEKSVNFKAYYLPKDCEEYFQFCYVDENGEVRGASTPFQLCKEVEDDSDMLMVMPEEMVDKLQVEILDLKEKASSDQKTIENLQDTIKKLESKIKGLLIQLEPEKSRKITPEQPLELDKIQKQSDYTVQKLQSELKGMKQSLNESRLEKEHLQELLIQLESEMNRTNTPKQPLELDKIQKQCDDVVQKLQTELKGMEQLFNKSGLEKEHLQEVITAQEKKIAKLCVDLAMQEVAISELKEKSEVESQNMKHLQKENKNLQNDVEEQKAKTLEATEKLNKQLKSTEKKMSELQIDLHQQKIVNTAQQKALEKQNDTIAEQEARITQLSRQNKVHLETVETWKKRFQDAQNGQKLKDVKMKEEIRTVQQTHEQEKEHFQKLEDENAMLQKKLNEQKCREEEFNRQLKETQKALSILENKTDQQKHCILNLEEEVKGLECKNSLLDVEISHLKEVQKKNLEEIDFLHQIPHNNSACSPPSQGSSLFYGNPYEGDMYGISSGELQRHGGHVHSHQNSELQCKLCNQIFPEHQKQMFEDHLLCHELDNCP
ncbi:calcium-binding and coiled-coil domain-containing 2 isoform X1 [Pelobates cultripes]|uniref:Calcium-binding and coiled-coil domain-containing 2 isoform X1 n=1 Tax=Pelobates cultripes TaxID=61616 RepID=A0AAD1SK96_PELCU|nr:calcium-binding and coiled-coil domain-containing 2 isoform X1 [Pelobates cultripes]